MLASLVIDLALDKTSGIVKIPVCTVGQVIRAVSDDPRNEKENGNYPCPA